MNHNYQIKADCIMLRPLLEKDLELVRQWRNRDEIRQWFVSQEIIEKEQQLTWYRNYLLKENDLMFIIEETEELIRPIGTAALYNIDLTGREAEFGRLFLGDDAVKGKGYGLKATKSLCEFGFSQLGLKKIYLEVFSDNEKAKKLYTNIGFEEESQSVKNQRTLIKMVLTVKSGEKIGEHD